MIELLAGHVPNLRVPAPGRFVGGDPGIEGLAGLVTAGIRTVVDLRPSSEWSGMDWKAAVEEAGMVFGQVPVDRIEALDRIALEQVWRYWRDDSLHPVLFHCASGNRVGAALALAARRIGGESAATALALGDAAGLGRSRELVRALLADDREG